jgi:hypothetical protein
LGLDGYLSPSHPVDAEASLRYTGLSPVMLLDSYMITPLLLP